MLNLSAQNIHLNAQASNKEQAIRLVAQSLVENGNVVAGYENGMLTREMQTSTFLGNGIAIPHGTLDTRHLVQHTGVQIFQFPNGVEWDAGNTAYLVIGIAAKSDEHLTLLRQLTSILGDEALAETLAKTEDLDQFIFLLSEEAQFVPLSTDLISLNVESDSLLTLSAINASKLQEKGYVTHTFISNVVATPPLLLGNNLYLADSSQGNLANGIALARNTEGKTLITVAAKDDSLQSLLALLLQSANRETLTSAPMDKILELLASPTSQQGGSSPQNNANAPEHRNERDLEAIFTVHNAHGLHARPSAVLVNEVKKYNATVQVQNLDRNTALVSAKSLMKVVALGTQKGHRLRFVATGEQAQQALEGIGAAINSGLGE